MVSSKIKSKTISAILAMILLSSTAMFAQDASTTTAPTTPDTMTQSLVFLIVGTVMLIFAGVIYVFSRYLHHLAKETVERAKSNSKTTKIISTLLLMIVSSQLFSQTTNAANSTAAVAISTSSFLEWFIISILVLLLLLTIMLGTYVNRLTNALYGKAKTIDEKEAALDTEGSFDRFLRWLNNAKPLHKEEDVLLDHDYDGIKELDNSLPPWWLYGFYFTIIFAVVYLWYYQVSHAGPNSREEYELSMKEAADAKIAMLGTQNETVDENNVQLITDKSKLSDAESTFKTICAACHGVNGEGNIGPNLTDQYWLHGCSINEVFKTIKYGVPAKGMVAWEKSFSPTKIQQLASYVISLKGSNPGNGKEPQGVVCGEGAVSDSSAVPIDSTQKK